MSPDLIVQLVVELLVFIGAIASAAFWLGRKLQRIEDKLNNDHARICRIESHLFSNGKSGRNQARVT